MEFFFLFFLWCCGIIQSENFGKCAQIIVTRASHIFFPLRGGSGGAEPPQLSRAADEAADCRGGGAAGEAADAALGGAGVSFFPPT